MNKVNPEQLQRLKGLMLNKQCAICGEIAYAPERVVYKMETDNGYAPVIRFVCGKCGHVVTFSAS